MLFLVFSFAYTPYSNKKQIQIWHSVSHFIKIMTFTSRILPRFHRQLSQERQILTSTLTWILHLFSILHTLESLILTFAQRNLIPGHVHVMGATPYFAK